MRSAENFSKKNSTYFRKNLTYSLLIFAGGTLFGGVIGVFLFMYITGGSAQPSQPISAPPLSLNSDNAQVTTSQENTEESVDTQLSTENASFELATPEQAVQSEPVVEAEATEIPAENPASPQLFQIVSEESEARFSVYETFPLGTAVGRTDQIAGEFLVDFANPTNSQLGTIRINLRTLQTDDADRDRSIRCCVLLTAQAAHEFTDFVPTSITGLPSEPVEIGQTVGFSVLGNLTLRGVTAPASFDVRLQFVDEEEVHGFATAIVDRNDFGILNNDENGFDYHGVEDSVTLDFDFIARAVSE